MKKLSQLSVLTLAVLLGLSACGKEKETPPATPPSSEQSAQPENQSEPADTTTKENKESSNGTPSADAPPLDEYKAFAKLTEKVQKELASADTATADKLYVSHKKAMDNLLETYNEKYSPFLENWDDSSSDMKKHTEAAKNAQLEFNGMDELGMSLLVKPDYYEKLFAGKTSTEVSEYIKLKAYDDAENIISDAAITASWDELGKRVANWENYLKKYPNSPFKKEAKYEFAGYTSSFLFGEDNSPVLSTTNPDLKDIAELYAQVEKSWAKFSQEHPDSSVVPMIETARKLAKMPDSEAEKRYQQIDEFRHNTLGISEEGGI